MLTKERTQEIVAQYGSNPQDTGRTEVQVALLSERISMLTEHLKACPKDHASRRGLLKLVGRRRNFLKYLVKNDLERYQSIISSLNIRPLK